MTTTSGSHVSGCDYQPVYETYTRSSACNGSTGADGSTPSIQLREGTDGEKGAGSFLVQDEEGTTNTYFSAFDFSLVGFDVRDENGDGIFEPGECAIVHGVRVTNRGGLSFHNIRAS